MSVSLREIRALMQQQGVDAFLVGSEDAHQSEYVCAADMRRQFISGFTGSAGTALILATQALVWTDGRYFLQAEQELSSEWTLMKSGEKDVLELPDWVLAHLSAGQKVGIDAWLVTTASAKAMKTKFASKSIELVTVSKNLVDSVWQGRPGYPCSAVETLDLSRAGKSHQDKIEAIRIELRNTGTVGFVVTMLDEVVWLLNVRGADVEFNPVVISYAVVTLDGVYWFVDEAKVTPEVRQHLGVEVTIKPYEEVEAFLANLAATGQVLADLSKTNYRLAQAIGETAVVDKVSPITLPKSLKNDAELNGIRACHIRDGVALTAFLHWLQQTVRAAPDTFSEYDVAVKIEEFRGKMADHVGPSFSTIAGYGPNGAVIHYKPEADTAGKLGVNSLFLLDSGAQYRDGTTDVTRTVHFGTATEHMKNCYTAVLKGHIALATLVIPEGTLGSRIDAFARAALWKLGLDYNHGTGHGVGAYLNVHEGPQGIGFRKRDNEVGFHPGMTISNEPGYYENGNFGIRIENVCISRYMDTPFQFNGKRSLGFENATMVPIETDLINVDMMDEHDVKYLNAYNAEVREKLLPLMKETFPEAVDYLLQKTAAIARG